MSKRENRITRKEQDMLNWQKNIVESLNNMTFAELITKSIEVSQPDDQDGCMTMRGSWEATVTLHMLYRVMFELNMVETDAIPDDIAFIARG